MYELQNKYGYAPNEEAIGRSIELLASSLDNVSSPEVLKQCYSLMDVTTLAPEDTEKSVKKLISKVDTVIKNYPDYPLPASVCVFPNLVHVVAEGRPDQKLHATAVASCFPSSQSFLEVKVRECELAVEAGADEIDIVLALNAFMAEEYDRARLEIRTMKAAIDKVAKAHGREVVLKVILETGLLVTPEAIAEASFIAMEEGADFIKTSTGKVKVNATPVAAYVMCECIKKFYEKTGRKVGFKAAGGISSAKDALCYYSIVSSVLGKEWIDPKYFRFGVSRLANSLMSAIENKTVSVF